MFGNVVQSAGKVDTVTVLLEQIGLDEVTRSTGVRGQVWLGESRSEKTHSIVFPDQVG